MARVITTAEELLRAGDIGRCELIRGKLRRMHFADCEHGRIAAQLGVLLDRHVNSRQLGALYATGTGFLLARNPDTVRAPDVAFVRADRAGSPSPGYYPGAPDLAVEVLEPDDEPGYVRDKVAEWLEAGAPAVWVVDPRARTVVVHEPNVEPRVFGDGDTLPGGDVLPGFALAVAEIFA